MKKEAVNLNHQKKKVVIFSAVVLVLLTAVTVILVLLFTSPKIVMSVNGIDIGEDEYRMFMQRNVADTVNSFDTINTSGELFWTSSIDDRVPLDVLRETTQESIVQTQVIYQLAKENNLVDEVGYQSFLNRMQAENKDRAEKVKKNEPVYGLSKFTERDYLDFELDKIEKSICTLYENTKFTCSDDEIQHYYEENKEKFFGVVDIIEVNYIEIPYYRDNLTQSQIQSYKLLVTEVLKQTDDQHTVKVRGEENEQLKPYCKELRIDSSTYSNLSKTQGALIDEVLNLQAGQVSTVIDNGESLMLIQCTSREEQDYRKIEEVTSIITKNLREIKYKELIADLAKEAVIEIDEKQLSKMKPY